MKKLILFSVAFIFTLWCNAQSIEKFSIDSGGASASADGIQILYTIGEVHVQELNVGGISVSEGFINANFKIQIDQKPFYKVHF